MQTRCRLLAGLQLGLQYHFSCLTDPSFATKVIKSPAHCMYLYFLQFTMDCIFTDISLFLNTNMYLPVSEIILFLAYVFKYKDPRDQGSTIQRKQVDALGSKMIHEEISLSDCRLEGMDTLQFA